MDLLVAKRLKYFKNKELEKKKLEIEKLKEEYKALCALCALLEGQRDEQ